MEAYYANAIDVTMLRREQERIGAELRAVESRQGTLDANLDDWQEVMDLAIRFSTRCATPYRRGSDRTRRLFNTAVLDQVHVRAIHEKADSPGISEWALEDSNLRPQPCEGCALTS